MMNRAVAFLTYCILTALNLTLFLASAEATEPPVRPAQGPPNIVVMMVDDMGFAGPSIAPYGNPHYKTPGRGQYRHSPCHQ